MGGARDKCYIKVMLQAYRKLSYKIVVLYFLVLFFFLLLYSSKSPSVLHILIQITVCLSFVFLSICLLRYNAKKSTVLNALFIVLLFQVLLFRIFQIYAFENPLGYNPIDALSYHNSAIEYCNSSYSIFKLPKFLSLNNTSIDDAGFSCIVCLIYKIFGSDAGLHILAFLNICVYVGGCSMLYKLSNILTSNADISKFTLLLWGTYTYCVYTASTGLKENFFVFTLIWAILSLYKYLNCRNAYRLVVFLLVSSLSLLFRLPVFFILVATLLISVFLQFKFVSKHIKFWIVILIVSAVIAFPTVLSYIVSARGNMALNQGMLDAINSGENLIVYIGTVVLTSLVGAVPNFISDFEKLNYITLWNFGSFVRIILSGYAFYAVYKIIKYRCKRYYPLLIFVALHIVMLVVTMFSIHDRYQMPQLPFIYLLTSLGVFEVSRSGSNVSKFFNTIYPFGAAIFVVVFNIYKN